VDTPVVSSVSPSSGPTAGGTTVTLTGTGLATTSAVTFDGVAGSALTVVTDGEVTVVTPAHAAGDVDVVVTTAGGSATVVDGFTFVAPTLTDVNPDAGSSSGGTSVTLTGSGLTGATAVTFGGDPATNLVVVDDSSITVTTPSHAAGLVDVVVSTPGGPATLLDGFTYADSPVLLSMSPTSGPAAGGTTVTLTGAGLDTTTSVTFGGAPAAVLSASDTEVIVVTPAGTPGLVNVEVTTAGGSSTVVDGYEYTP